MTVDDVLFAVVELPNRKTCNLPLISVPNANEGTVLNIDIDESVTVERQNIIKEKFVNYGLTKIGNSNKLHHTFIFFSCL